MYVMINFSCSINLGIKILTPTDQVPRGDSHMKGTGVLVVSFRGLNFGFWSHLGCSGQTLLYLAVKVSFRVTREEI